MDSQETERPGGTPPETDWVRDALNRHEAPLLRHAARLTGDLETARDVVQETFLRLCRADRARIGDHLVPWLHTVCRNLALDHLRKEQRMVALDDHTAASLPGREAPPSASAERAEARSRADALIGGLPPKQQEVLRLKFQDALSYEEISRITGLSVSNVGYLIHTGLKTARQHLADAAAPAVPQA